MTGILRLSLSLILFQICLLACKTIQVPTETTQLIRVSEADSVRDYSIDDMITPYRQGVMNKMNKVIAHLDTDLSKDRPESTLGNWLVDMIYDEVHDQLGIEIDFALQNQGGIRLNSIARGPLTIGTIYEVMPFDNLVSLMKLTGDQTRQLIDHLAHGGGWPLSRNVQYRLINKTASDIRINGAPLHQDSLYLVALPDYVANGGSDSHFLRDIDKNDLDLLIRDLFINHISRETSLGLHQSAEIDHRVITTPDE